MPVYKYNCPECEYDFEAFQKMADRDKQYCLKCNKKADKLITAVGISIDSNIKDSVGTPIWFPKDGSSYYDRALDKTFHSKKEKQQYMNKEGIIMDGSDWKKLPIEAGDVRKEKQ